MYDDEYRIIVCGSRDWTDGEKIRRILHDATEVSRLFGIEDITIIHGGCRGADRLAGKVARDKDWDVEEFPADWDKHGKAAGPIRNSEMLKQSPDLVIAFHGNISKSKGTKDMIFKANRAGVAVQLYGD